MVAPLTDYPRKPTPAAAPTLGIRRRRSFWTEPAGGCGTTHFAASCTLAPMRRAWTSASRPTPSVGVARPNCYVPGANMYHVKELLGHESLDTLKHYAWLTITDLKKTHRRCHPRERDRR